MRILHMFNWNLRDIEGELSKIAEQGFDAIQINPIQPLKDEKASQWWMSYQPCGFEIGNRFGSKEDLQRLCFTAKQYGISVIADVVCNHVAGADDGSLKPSDKVDKKITSHPEYFKEFKNIKDWDNRYEVTHYCLGLPGLNVYNHDVQDMITDYLNELIDCGVEGFRFDAAKNIALPSEGCDFWPRVLSNLKRQDLFMYGEVIFENEQRINQYGEFINVVTNSDTNKRDLLVKFVESHDSYLEFGYTKKFSSDEISRQYGDLTRQYPHTLYYARPFDNGWKSPIVKNANYANGKVYKKVS